MDRRESLKSMLIGSLAGGALVNGCASPEAAIESQELAIESGVYGRTEKEKIRDAELSTDKFFSIHELETIATLCDLILPPEGELKSASEAGVPEFIEFIAKDIPRHQLPIRGGIMWLDNFSNESFGKSFKACDETEQTNLLDQIAYPNSAKPEVSQGVKFFTLMRNLTLTGFYTSKLGVQELGYAGNTPNVWDGVPADVLNNHGLSYDDEWLAKCVDQDKRMDVAKWDDDGNLIS